MATLEGDRATALDYLARARESLTANGQRPLLEAVTRAEHAVRSKDSRTPRPDGLTPRELEVLRGVASGQSNKQIASELFLSVHTVERHVANVYRKIGAHNRAQAAAYATRLKL
jgi:DNA-binding NarL/FixJ family response regulator